MSYNNNLNMNDCITNLQTLDDYNLDISRLKLFIEDSNLAKEDEAALKQIIKLMAIKNTTVKNTINKTMNSLNKMGLYTK